MKVTVLSSQSLSDIALQVYGSVEGVFTLAKDNGLSVTDKLTPGQELEYSVNKVINNRIAEYYAGRGIHPATAFDGNVDERIFDSTFDLTFN